MFSQNKPRFQQGSNLHCKGYQNKDAGYLVEQSDHRVKPHRHRYQCGTHAQALQIDPASTPERKRITPLPGSAGSYPSASSKINKSVSRARR